MSIDLQLEVRETYVRAVVVGTVDLDELVKHFSQVLDACARHGLTNVLVDARGLKGPMSLGERYQWAAHASEGHRAHVAAGNRPLRLAVLVGDELRDGRRFVQAVTQNRGLDTRTTANPAEAAAWLGIDPASLP